MLNAVLNWAVTASVGRVIAAPWPTAISGRPSLISVMSRQDSSCSF